MFTFMALGRGIEKKSERVAKEEGELSSVRIHLGPRILLKQQSAFLFFKTQC